MNFKSEEGSEEIDLAVFILKEPAYEAESKTLTYFVEDIPLDSEYEGMTTNGGFLQNLPGELWELSLFIDPADTISLTEVPILMGAVVCLTGNAKEGYQFCVADIPGCCE